MTNENPQPDSSTRAAAASRANGATSHGPTTPEGRLKCGQAAAKANLKHGMLASTIVIHGESQARFDELVTELTQSFNPVSRAEHICIEKMAVAFWRQRRAWAIQKIGFDREMATQDLDAPAPLRATVAFDALCENSLLDKAHRYESAYDRQYDRALAKLERLQATRLKTLGLPDLPAPSVAASNWEAPQPVQDSTAT